MYVAGERIIAAAANKQTLPLADLVLSRSSLTLVNAVRKALSDAVAGDPAALVRPPTPVAWWGAKVLSP